MIKTAAAITILAAATLAGQYIDPTTKQAIHNNAQAEIKRGQLLRQAFNAQTSYENCKQHQQRMQVPNPYACEPFNIKAKEKQAEAAAVQTVAPRLTPQQQQPMSASYDPARAANRQYPAGSRPDLPPQMIPSAGQVAQGVWHGLQNGQTTFTEDPSQISGQPAVDYRNTMGGNAGGQNGQSTFGSNLGGGSYHPRYAQPRIQPIPQQQQHQQRRYPQRQGRYVRGKLVY